MVDYIERKKVYEMLNALGGCGAEPESWADGWDKAIDTAIEELNKIPSADVRPERRGEWIPEADYGICSECGADHSIFDTEYVAYCPGCGAKMDGKGGESDE